METSGSLSLRRSSGQMLLTDKACSHGEHLGHEDDLVAEAQGYGRKWTPGSQPGVLSRNFATATAEETSVDKTMYMKSDIKCYYVPFVLCLPALYPSPMLCSFSSLFMVLSSM